MVALYPAPGHGSDVGFFGLLLFSPVFAILAVAVRFSSAGPMIFRQQRVGRMGQLFTIYKFRTMEAQPQPKGLSVTRHGDRRVTAVVVFCAATSWTSFHN